MSSYQFTVPGCPQEIARARRWTRDILAAHPRAEDAALVVTELGTNALLHAAGRAPGCHPRGVVGVTVVLLDQAVVIAVTDNGGGSTRPHLAHPARHALHGRGLTLVSALADHVRITGDPTSGHTVTAHLASVATARGRAR